MSFDILCDYHPTTVTDALKKGAVVRRRMTGALPTWHVECGTAATVDILKGSLEAEKVIHRFQYSNHSPNDARKVCMMCGS